MKCLILLAQWLPKRFGETNLSQNGNIAFYVNLPAGTVNLPSNASDNAKAAMTDGKYGIKLGLAANNDQDTVATTVLANTSFTYYFEDGTTYTAQNESGIYPYKNKNGEIISNMALSFKDVPVFRMYTDRMPKDKMYIKGFYGAQYVGGKWINDGDDFEKAVKATEIYGGQAFSNYDEMLDSGIDTVHICTPHYLHFEMAEKAVKKENSDE